MPLRINKSAVDAIVTHARRDAPVEACGYLAAADGVIVEALALRNADASGEHFSFVPKEQFDAIRALRTRGLRAVAVYHNHPATPARPSAEDIRLANDPSISYVIVSLSDAAPVVKSFKIVGGVVTNEEIIVI